MFILYYSSKSRSKSYESKYYSTTYECWTPEGAKPHFNHNELDFHVMSRWQVEMQRWDNMKDEFTVDSVSHKPFTAVPDEALTIKHKEFVNIWNILPQIDQPIEVKLGLLLRLSGRKNYERKVPKEPSQGPSQQPSQGPSQEPSKKPSKTLCKDTKSRKDYLESLYAWQCQVYGRFRFAQKLEITLRICQNSIQLINTNTETESRYKGMVGQLIRKGSYLTDQKNYIHSLFPAKIGQRKILIF